MPSGLPSASAFGKQGALCLNCPTACRGGDGEKEGLVGERASWVSGSFLRRYCRSSHSTVNLHHTDDVPLFDTL